MNTVTIKTFNDYFTANIYLTRLESDGIKCYLFDEHTVTIDPLLTNAIGGIKLVVNKKDAEDALKLLKLYHNEQMQQVKCPTCGEGNFIQIPKKSLTNYITALTTWIFTKYAAATEMEYQCANCGYKCDELPETNQAI